MSRPRPKPTAIRRLEGNRGKRAWNHDEPQPPDAMPRCPEHLAPVAKAEWRRVARTLHAHGGADHASTARRSPPTARATPSGSRPSRS